MLNSLKRFYNLKRNSWVDKVGRLGIKKDLVKEVATKVSSLKLEIKQILGHTNGALLSMSCLTSSHQCFTDFLNCTEEFFLELQEI